MNPASKDEIVTVAVGPAGHVLSGIITEPTTRDVRPGSFMNAIPVTDGPSLPSTVILSAAENQIAAAVVSSDKAGTLAFAFVLPAAEAATVPLAALVHGASPTQYNLMALEFSGALTSEIDGGTILHKMKRFTRSQALIKTTEKAPQF
jgi:hypothetical protein